MNKAKEFLEKETEKYKGLFKSSQKAYWNAALSGKKEDYKKYEETIIKWIEYLSNKENFEKIKTFLENSLDNLEKRQLRLLYLEHLKFQGDKELLKEIAKKETELEQKFNTFRARINKEEFSDNQIKEMLKKETDSEKLRKAWEASKKQGEVVEKGLLEIIRLRNKLAKSLGFENYYLMSLEINEQKLKDLEKIFSKIDLATKNKFEKLKYEIDEKLSERYGVLKEDLKPWHYQDLFFQEAPEIYNLNLDEFYKKDILEIAKKFYNGIGLEVEDILKRSDLYEKPGKYQHACCIDLDREGDSRIIQNIKNNKYWMSTTLHELGHAVYDKYFNKNLSFLLRGPAHTFLTEAIAIFFEQNSKNPNFIKRFSNKKEIPKDIRKQLILEKMILLRWFQVMFNFEKKLYENPNQDLNKLWWEIVEKYQGIKFYRNKPDWASKIHFTSAPVYYHNYMLGNLLSSQIHNYLIKKILVDQNINDFDYFGEKVGNFLKEKIFLQGRKYNWKELIEKALGENLDPKYFIEEFSE